MRASRTAKKPDSPNIAHASSNGTPSPLTPSLQRAPTSALQPADVLRLQGTIGNQAVQRLLQSGAPPVIQRMKTAWGSPITYSWEREGSNLEILRYYRDSAMSDEDWLKLGAGQRPDSVGEEVWTPLQDKFGLTGEDVGWKPSILKEYMKLKGLEYNHLVKLSTTPDFMRDNLLEEGGGTSWETTHPHAETDVSAIFEQVNWLDEHLGIDKGSPPYHFHMVFQRPTFESDEHRAEWAKNMAGFATHLNLFSALRSYGGSTDINNSFLGPYSGGTMVKLHETLLQENIPRVNLQTSPMTPVPEGSLEYTDSSGHNVGDFKFATTAFRQTYKSRVPDEENGGTKDVFDPEKFGFEFRAIKNLRDTYEHLSNVAQVMNTTKFHDRGFFDTGYWEKQISLGGNKQGGKKYTFTQLNEFYRGVGERPVSQLRDRHPEMFDFLSVLAVSHIATEHKKKKKAKEEGREYKPSIPWVRSTPDRKISKIGFELMKRWTMPLAEWENHPAVPDEQKKAIVIAREEWYAELEDYRQKLALVDRAIKQATESGEEEKKEKLEKNREAFVEKLPIVALNAANVWGDKTRLWQYF